MRRIVLLAGILLCLCAGSVAAQNLFDDPVTQDRVKVLDSWIKKHAPSDSAFKKVNSLANRQIWMQRAIVAKLIYENYRPYFKKRREFFDRKIEQLEKTVLTQHPTDDIRYLYDNYVNEEAPSERAFVAVQKLAALDIYNKRWDSAAATFKRYKKLFPDMKERFDGIIKILQADTVGLEINNIGRPVNSARAEWDPNPTQDGKYLYFSSTSRPGGHGQTDVWRSEMKNGKWQEPENLGPNINGRQKETIDNVSADGNGLYLSGEFPGTFGQFDIFYAEMTDSGWSKLHHYPAPINTEHVDEAPNMTSDGKALLFSSDRPGGIGEYVPFNTLFHGSSNGNMDIYVCEKTEDGWSEPINLGRTINTPYAERSPYLHPDGKTLYFSSGAHSGLGGLDVFKTVRQSEDSWTEWREPVNLGKEINTMFDDWGYNIGIKGDSAFFASKNRPGGYGDWDIYSITLPEEAQPEPVVRVSGVVTDTKGNPLSADIVWEDLETGKNRGRLRSNPQDGSFFIPLPAGKNYGFYAEKEGYYPTARNVDLRQLVAEPDVKDSIVMVSIKEMKEEGAKIRINNIFFDFDKHKLKKESYPELRRLAEFLKDHPELKVRLEGHTDEIGEPNYNKKLSIERAEAVKEFLIKKGCRKDRFSVEGFGAAKPVASNKTNFGRQMNRRVELYFVSPEN